jgi:glycosyltransferase involved in cell wall biosynthesis
MPRNQNNQSNMDLTFVSIIITNYNYREYLDECIQSALNQTYEKKEVIIVDDGSKDGSIELIESYRKKVHAIFKRNGGQASAMNAGLLKANGDFVIFLDSDDYLYEEAIEIIIAHLNKDMSRLHYRLDVINRIGKKIGKEPNGNTPMFSGDAVSKLINSGSIQIVPTSGNVFNKCVLDEIFPIPEDEFRLNADFYLIAKSSFYGQVGCVDDCLGAYRVHGKNNFCTWLNSIDAKDWKSPIQHYFQSNYFLEKQLREIRSIDIDWKYKSIKFFDYVILLRKWHIKCEYFNRPTFIGLLIHYIYYVFRRSNTRLYKKLIYLLFVFMSEILTKNLIMKVVKFRYKKRK